MLGSGGNGIGGEGGASQVERVLVHRVNGVPREGVAW